MAKKDIHPHVRNVVYTMPNGSSFSIPSCYGKEAFTAEIDIWTHPAWRASSENYVNQSAANIAKFNKHFSLSDYKLDVKVTN
jgi:ribosomal protein L31